MIFLERFLTVQLSTGSLKCATTLNLVLSMFSHSRPWRGKKNIFIDDDHGCKATAMIPQELLKHLKNEGDSTHTAIFIYLQTLNSFSRGHTRQDPGVNSKKEPHSEEEV